MPPTRPRALVADDEPTLRSLFTAYLGREYAVTTASDGAAAERALLADPPFALAVLDCDMPARSGPEALVRARAAGCQTPVLLVSGSGSPPGEGLTRDPRTAFLAKPFTQHQLLQAVAALLAVA